MPPFSFCALQFARDLANDRTFRSLGRDVARDQLEDVGTRSRALRRRNLDSLVTDYDLHAAHNIVKFHRARAFRRAIDCDPAIHHCRFHFDLLAVDADESLLIVCHVKICRENAVRRRRRELRILVSDDFGSMLPQAQNQFIERFDGVR